MYKFQSYFSELTTAYVTDKLIYTTHLNSFIFTPSIIQRYYVIIILKDVCYSHTNNNVVIAV